MIGKEEIIRHWQIQEHLLQGYRLLFLISQTLLVVASAVLTALADSLTHVLIFSILLVPGLILLRYWQRIATARSLDVSFLQGMLYNYNLFENKDNLMQEFKHWQKLSRTDKVKRIEELSIEPSQTRKIMELRIPLVYAAMWLILTLIIVYKSNILS